MKKFIFTALVAAFATTSFAQDIVKQMKGQSYAEATATLNGALSGLSAEQKAKGYNQLVEILDKETNEAFNAITLANMNKTKVEYEKYLPIVNSLNEAVKCDEFDNQPNDKGKVAPKFRKKNADRLANLRTVLINAANETTDPDKKLVLANAYINSSESPLFAEALKAGDPYIGYAQFFAAAAYYNKEDWNKAANYAEKALKCDDVKENAEQYLVSALTKNLKTKSDTSAYLKKLNEINAEKYMAQIASLYNQIGEKQLSDKILNDAIAANPNNKMAYAIKGENAMNDRNWDEAIKNFKKTVEIDPAFTAVWFNLGVCASSKGFDLNEKLSNNGKISVEDDAKVKEVLKEAVVYYEKVRQLDPNRETISNWPYQLRMIYNALGETEKAAEISKMLGE
jgi:tetratricopeptide (TPR) repeat protein